MGNGACLAADKANCPEPHGPDFDLGAVLPVNTFVLDVFSQYDPRTPKDFTIQVSSDNVHFWNVLSGTNPPATAAAAPPDEPPGVRDGSHGLRVTPLSKVDV